MRCALLNCDSRTMLLLRVPGGARVAHRHGPHRPIGSKVLRPTWPGFFLLRRILAQQQVGFNTERPSDALQHLDRGRMLLSLQSSNIVPIDADSMRQLFLRESARLPKLSNILCNGLAQCHAGYNAATLPLRSTHYMFPLYIVLFTLGTGMDDQSLYELAMAPAFLSRPA